MNCCGFILNVPVEALAERCSPERRQPRLGEEAAIELARLTLVDAAQFLLGELGANDPTLDRPTTFRKAASIDLDAPAAVGALPGRTVVLTNRVPPFEGTSPLLALSKLGDLFAFYSDDRSGSFLYRLFREGKLVRRWEAVPPGPRIDEGTMLPSEPTGLPAGDHFDLVLETFAGGPALWSLPMETH